IVAFFLLRGGGLSGFAVSWTADILSGFIDSIGDAGRRLSGTGETIAIAGPLLALLGKSVTLLSTVLSLLIRPLIWLRDQIQASGGRVWADFTASAAIISALVFVLFGGTRSGWHPLIVSLATFAGVGVVIAAMGLDRGGLPVVDTRLWGGLLVTLVVSVTGIV